jgi:hypothetical protein
MGPKNNPEEIAQAAANFVGAPHSDMQDALNSVKNDCRLSSLAFGVIGSLLLSGPYETSRSAQESSLSAGVKLVDDVSSGLKRVAAHWQDEQQHDSKMMGPH